MQSISAVHRGSLPENTARRQPQFGRRIPCPKISGKKLYVSQNRQRVAAWLDPTTQPQRRRPRAASIATATTRRRSLQRMVSRRCIHAQLRIFQSSKQPISNGDRYADTQAPKATVRQGNCQLMLALGCSNCEHQRDDSDYQKEYRTGNDKHRVFQPCRFLQGQREHKPCDAA
jgi:hypothetical protein